MALTEVSMDKPRYIERRSARNSSLSKDIAQHLYTRQLPGVAIVVVENPHIFMSSLRKQWFAILRTVQKERASTLTSERIRELNRQSMYMQRVPMAATVPDPDFKNGVFLVTPTQLAAIPPALHTIYITTPLEAEALNELYDQIPPHSLVVLY